MSNQHTCDRCGICCKHFLINLDEHEYRSGKYQLIFGDIDLIDDFELASECGANLLAKNEEGGCIYLQNNRCSIHADRPKVCRDFFCKSDDQRYHKMIESIQRSKAKID